MEPTACWPCKLPDLPITSRFNQVLCPIVIGRDAELALIEQALAGARAGDGGVVILLGEAGIGKSRLTAEAEKRARATAMRVLRGRAAAGAVPVPYRPLVEALQSALRTPGQMDDPTLGLYRGVLRAFLPDGDGPGPEVHRLLILEAAGRLLASIGRRDGVVLILEDLHWADADTLALVDYFADNLTRDRVLCVCTMRDEPGPALDLAEALAARRAASLLRLERLPPLEVECMALAALAVESVPKAFVDALADRAEGVPFVVEEMLTAYVSSGGDARARSALPHTFRELVKTRLAAVDDRTRDILFAAAVIGRTFSWSLLCDLSGLSRELVLSALHNAVRAQLVVSDAHSGFETPFRFRHALVRESLVAELLAPELTDLSRRAADAIEQRFPGLPGEWCGRVAQLREAAGDWTAAARHLQEAATRAVGRGALGSAIDMLEHARSLTTHDRWHTVGIDRQLIQVLSLAGRIDRLKEIGATASAFIDEKRRLLPGITLARGEIHLLLARAFAAVGDDAAVEEHLAQARDYLAQTGEKRVLAALHVFQALRDLARGDVAEARAGAGIALAMAEQLRDDQVIGDALSVEGNAALVAGDTVTALQVFRREREDARRPIQRLRALLDLGSAEASLDGSTETLNEVRALATESGALEYGMRAELAIGRALIDRFDLAAAERHLAECINTSRRHKLALLPEALVVEARRLALAGDPLLALQMVGEAGFVSDEVHLARAVIALLREDLAVATAALEPARLGTAVALSALLCAASTGAFQPMSGGGAVADGLLAHAGAVSTCDESGWADADAKLMKYPWWRHIARRIVAEAALNMGWREAPASLRESMAFFESAGHSSNLHACRALLRRARVPVPRKGRGDSSVPQALSGRGVTSREMDVLHLVAAGLGNRDIAARLFISHRTVESHVESLMRKLNADSREELAAGVVQS